MRVMDHDRRSIYENELIIIIIIIISSSYHHHQVISEDTAMALTAILCVTTSKSLIISHLIYIDSSGRTEEPCWHNPS